MATFQFLRPSLPSSLSHPIFHTFPSTPCNYFPKFIASKGISVTPRHCTISPRAFNSQYSPQIADSLNDVSIFTAAGEPVRFNDLWDQNQVSIPYNFFLFLDVYKMLISILNVHYSFFIPIFGIKNL